MDVSVETHCANVPNETTSLVEVVKYHDSSTTTKCTSIRLLSVMMITSWLIYLFVCIGIWQYNRNFNAKTSDIYEIDEIDSYDQSCNSEITCNGHGICGYYTNGCKCDDGYITYNNHDTYNSECNYKQKSQETAFLLSLFLGGCGADRFYIGDIAIGVLKLLLPFIACYTLCCCISCGAYVGESNGASYTSINRSMDGSEISQVYLMCCGMFLPVTILIGWGIWCLVETILYALNDINDGNGAPLAPW